MQEIKKFTLAEIKVMYRPKKIINFPKISSSAEALQYIMVGFNLNTISLQEQFVVLYLNRSNTIIGFYKASVGGITSTVVDPRIILSVALKLAAVGLIIAHNHPSGSCKPSIADEDLTNRLKEGAKILDIKLLDHLIVNSSGNYHSFADEGAL